MQKHVVSWEFQQVNIRSTATVWQTSWVHAHEREILPNAWMTTFAKKGMQDGHLRKQQVWSRAILRSRYLPRSISTVEIPKCKLEPSFWFSIKKRRFPANNFAEICARIASALHLKSVGRRRFGLKAIGLSKLFMIAASLFRILPPSEFSNLIRSNRL